MVRRVPHVALADRGPEEASSWHFHGPTTDDQMGMRGHLGRYTAMDGDTEHQNPAPVLEVLILSTLP